MSQDQDPRSDYEAPSVEEVDTEDTPAVTAAGDDTATDLPPSDERLKHSVRPLEGTEINPKPDYEAPSVEEVDTEDAPAITAAGDTTVDNRSDERLKDSVRPLEGSSILPEPDYEAPSVEEVNTEDYPAVTAAGDTTVDNRSDERLKDSVRLLEGSSILPESDYEAPSVEEVDTEDAPAVTAAGTDSDFSDERLKHALRPLGATIIRFR